MNKHALELATPTDLEIVVTRDFDAPRALVFAAFTRPELVQRWLYGPDEWPMVHCAIDLRPGGALRYVWRHRERGDMGMGGVFREVAPPGRLVHTELFDEDWTGGEALVTTVFEDHGERTKVITTVRDASQQGRNAALRTGMLDGWGQSYDRLDGLLASPAGGQRQGAA